MPAHGIDRWMAQTVLFVQHFTTGMARTPLGKKGLLPGMQCLPTKFGQTRSNLDQFTEWIDADAHVCMYNGLGCQKQSRPFGQDCAFRGQYFEGSISREAVVTARQEHFCKFRPSRHVCTVNHRPSTPAFICACSRCGVCVNCFLQTFTGKVGMAGHQVL